jgi:tetratricopeptide (TPR) repeat protein
VPQSIATSVDRLDRAVPVPEPLRLVLAREALRQGNLVLAARDTAALRPSPDRLALFGGLAQARGDYAAAVRDYLAAGDLAWLEGEVDRLSASGRVAQALALQKSIVARLTEDRTEPDVLAEADFDLGRIEQAQAYRTWILFPGHRAHEVAAGRAYARAVALAPFRERYLIALGNQQLNLSELVAATRTFERARDADPTSIEALTGLGDAALRRGDRAMAATYLALARARAPDNESVRILERRFRLP